MKNNFEQLHQIISDADVIKTELHNFNDAVHSAGFYFRLDVPDEEGGIAYPNAEIPDNTILVLGSFDFSYYHQAEIVFFETKAHTIDAESIWADHWEKSQLTLLQGNEREVHLAAHSLPDNKQIHVFAFNIGSFGNEQYIIIAEGISIRTGNVFHYNRIAQEPLKPNERVAYWVNLQSK